MKKESVFIAILLISVTLAFTLGIKYQQNSALTGQAIFEKQIHPIEKSVIQIKETLSELKENTSVFNDYLAGGGSKSVFNESNSTYVECISWGASFCQNNNIKCPEQYIRVTVSDLQETKEEKMKSVYLCIKAETINSSKSKIGFDNSFRDSIFYP